MLHFVYVSPFAGSLLSSTLTVAQITAEGDTYVAGSMSTTNYGSSNMAFQPNVCSFVRFGRSSMLADATVQKGSVASVCSARLIRTQAPSMCMGVWNEKIRRSCSAHVPFRFRGRYE
jgi:hypothetical protein